MKANLLSYLISMLATGCIISCNFNDTSKKVQANEKDSANRATDSAMTAHQVDPSTAFPRPPVTGSLEDSSRTTDSTTWFISGAIQQNRDEIVLADMAIKNASSKEIKSIAENLKKEHTSMLNKLQQLQSETPAVQKNRPDLSVARRNIDMLQKLSGKEFDNNWTDAMIRDLQSTIDQYEKQLKQSSHKKTKSYIQNTLPKLKAMLKDLQSQSSIIYKT